MSELSDYIKKNKPEPYIVGRIIKRIRIFKLGKYIIEVQIVRNEIWKD